MIIFIILERLNLVVSNIFVYLQHKDNNMKVVIEYHNIECGAHIFATPEYTSEEVVEVEGELDDPKLVEYIEGQVDLFNNPFKKKESFGYNYVSGAGAVKVYPYVEPTPPTIKVL